MVTTSYRKSLCTPYGHVHLALAIFRFTQNLFGFRRCLALVFLHFSGNLKSWKYLFEFFISSSNLKPFQFHLALAIFRFTQNLTVADVASLLCFFISAEILNPEKYLFEFFISSSNLKPFQFHLALAIFCFTQNLFCFRRCLALVFLHFRLNTVTFCLELTKKTRRRVYSFIFFTAIAELEFSLRNNETENSSNNQQLKIYLF